MNGQLFISYIHNYKGKVSYYDNSQHFFLSKDNIKKTTFDLPILEASNCIFSVTFSFNFPSEAEYLSIDSIIVEARFFCLWLTRVINYTFTNPVTKITLRFHPKVKVKGWPKEISFFETMYLRAF